MTTSRGSRLLFAALVVIVSCAGCTANRPLGRAIVPETEFMSEARKIATPIELCLTPALRQRQWNAERHPFRIELGPRAALLLERMVKARFRTVEVTFLDACGAVSGLPYLEATIVGAHRELYQDVDDPPQYTAIELEATLRSNDGEVLWQAHEDGVVAKPLPLAGAALFAGWPKGTGIFFVVDIFASIEDAQRLEAAEVDFGEALSAAMQAAHGAVLRDLDEIRLRLQSERPDREGAAGSFGDARVGPDGEGDASGDDAVADDRPLLELAPLVDESSGTP